MFREVRKCINGTFLFLCKVEIPDSHTYQVQPNDEEIPPYYLISSSLVPNHLGCRREVPSILARHHFLHVLLQSAAVRYI